MAADFSKLQATIDALTAQVAATKTVEASAKAALEGFADAIKKAVTDALTADNAADDASIAAASKAIDDTTAAFQASAADLGAAIPANTPPAA